MNVLLSKKKKKTRSEIKLVAFCCSFILWPHLMNRNRNDQIVAIFQRVHLSSVFSDLCSLHTENFRHLSCSISKVKDRELITKKFCLIGNGKETIAIRRNKTHQTGAVYEIFRQGVGIKVNPGSGYRFQYCKQFMKSYLKFYIN